MSDQGSPGVDELIKAGRDREAARLGAKSTGRTQTVRTQTVRTQRDLMEPLAQLNDLMPTLGALVETVTPADLDRATPCTEFTVRGVLEHMVSGASAFAAGYRGDAPHDFDTTDVVAAWGQAMTELGEAVSAEGALGRSIEAPFGTVPGDTFARFIALDGLVHGWDISQAIGGSYQPSDDLVAAADEFARGAIEPLRGAAFAPAVEPPTGADAMTRLAAFTGRQV